MDTQDDTLAVVASAEAQASGETSEVKTTVVVDEANQVRWSDISIGLSGKSCQCLIPSNLLRIIKMYCVK